MGLLEEVQAAQEAKRPVRCRVCLTLNRMEPEEREEFQAVLDSEQYDSASIHHVMSNRGYDVGHNAIQRHRRGSCKGHDRR